MQVVRTIGRAFDVCHQLTQQQQQQQLPAKSSSVGELKSINDELDAAETQDILPDDVQPQTKGLLLCDVFQLLYAF